MLRNVASEINLTVKSNGERRVRLIELRSHLRSKRALRACASCFGLFLSCLRRRVPTFDAINVKAHT